MRSKNNIKLLIILILLIICFIVTIYYFIKSKKNDDLPLESNNQMMTSGEPTLYGSSEIYPSLMYDEKIYTWTKMAEITSKYPKGVLPDGYNYVGDITHESTGKLTENFQFVAKFEAEGQVFYNHNNLSNLYICITTDWLDNSYVIFTTN
jgi:hypothetical protein